MTSTEKNVPSQKSINLPGRKFRFKSIRTELIVIIVTILLVSGTLLTGIAALMASNALEESAINTLKAVGESSSTELLLVLATGEDLAALSATNSQVISAIKHLTEGTITEEEQTALFEHLTATIDNSSDIFKGINILDNNGICVFSNVIGNHGKDYSQFLPSANQQKTSNAYINEPYLGSGNEPQLGIIAPISDYNGKQLGFTLVGLRITEFANLVFSTPGLSADSTNFLVGPDGTIYSGVRGDYSPFLTEKFDVSIFPSGQNMAQAPGYYGNMEYIVKHPISSTNWSIITSETVNEVNGPITNLIMMMVFSLIIIGAAGILVTAYIATTFARPLRDLADIAEQLALGDVDAVVTHTGINEIGQLADAFRHIAKNTQRKAKSAKVIAAGDLKTPVIIASDKDVEGHALMQMRQTLFTMVESLQELANSSAEGNLSHRADATQFQGAYREVIETLNQAFDLIINPLQETLRLSLSYSRGEYSDRFDPNVTVKGDFIPFKDALNQIGIDSSNAVLHIRQGVQDIRTISSQASISIEDIATSVTTLAKNTSHVSSLSDTNDIGLDQALTAMNDLANTVGEVAQRATATSELVSQSSDLAYDGVKRAELAGRGMEEIMKAFAMTSEAVTDMSSQMEAIGGIVGVISSIAEQTSLLALNAAIEAARAGDAGLGFAVVADEVKSLAQESQTSAEHIGSIIGNLQKMSIDMTNGMNKSADVMQSGNNAVTETITIFNQIAEAIGDVNKNMSEVAAASEEQAASVEEITASMSEVRNMVQETAKAATDSAAAAEEISASLDEVKETAAHSAELARNIEEHVGLFKIE